MGHTEKNTEFWGFPLTFRFASIMLLFLISLSSFSQEKVRNQTTRNDSELLDSFIGARGYSSTIVFDASNIKQYWTDKCVAGIDNTIKLDLSLHESPLKFKLVNVNESTDCKVDIIGDTADLSFIVLNSQLKGLSNSSPEEDFINYKVCSSVFHLEDTNDFSFYLKFNSEVSPVLSIRKIVLSFSKNKNSNYLSSPGKLTIEDDFLIGTFGTSVEKTGNNTLTLSSKKDITLESTKYIYTNDNTFNMSLKVKNVGKSPASVYIGYIPLTKKKNQINNRVLPYKDNKSVFHVVSAEKGSSTITVDSVPEVWAKNCYLALNAKEDFSDFPNLDFISGAIVDVKEASNGQAEIVLSAPLDKTIDKGTGLRIQSSFGAKYLYVNPKKVLQPGEEAEFTSTITKDDEYFGYSSKAFCKGTYCVRPVIYSVSSDSSMEQVIQISDFVLSY